MGLSQLLKNSIKLSDKRHYLIAHEAGIHPTTLSRLLNGIDKIKPDDPRVIAVGRVLDIPPNECFDKAKQTSMNIN